MTDRRPGKACIRRKLMVLLMAGNALLLIAVSCCFVAFELGRIRQDRSSELAALGEMLGRELTAPVLAEDRAKTRQALFALAKVPHIVSAEVVSDDGSLLARYQAPHDWLSLPRLKQELARPIVSRRRTVATLRLVSQQNPYPMTVFSAVLLGLAVCGLLGLGSILTYRFKRLITDPIEKLSQTMESVSRNQDYHVRMQSWNDDELGFLFDCFNEMLAEISVRDERLALHSEELQLEVTERTRELSEVNRQLEVSLKEVSRTMQEAQAASRAKSDFLAQMSHEIRTPMYGVLGMTELLQNTDLSKEQTRFVETVHRSGEALLSIINNILDFSKIEAGRMELEVIPFDLHEIVTDAVEMFREEAGRKGLELRYEIRRDLPRSFLGDPGRLRQVMVNLLANAVKFTPQGSVRLVAFLDRPPDLVRISIRDTGIGIAPEAQERIFQQFSQGDESMTRKYGGTGLGLAIAKQLTELMGGEVSLASEPGQGSTFSFTVKLEPSPAHEWQLPEQCCKELRGKRVLLVADARSDSPLLGQLTGWGMDVESAGDVASALAKLAAAPFDLALLDQRVGGADGRELAARIKAVHAGHPVRLVLLCDDSPENTERAEHGGLLLLKRSLHPHRLYAALVCALGLDQGGAQEGDPSQRRAPHVLLVEDNPVNQEVGRGMLESLGCTVEMAENGLLAIDAVQQKSFDLVFMDCQMPELDGLEATRRIRRWEEAGGVAAGNGGATAADAKLVDEGRDEPPDEPGPGSAPPGSASSGSSPSGLKADPSQAAGRLGSSQATSPPLAPSAQHRQSRVPIISLTAYAMKGDRLACLEAGADDYLSKPFTREELSVVMSRQLQCAVGEGLPPQQESKRLRQPVPRENERIRPAVPQESELLRQPAQQPQAANPVSVPGGQEEPGEAISREHASGALEMIQMFPGDRGKEILKKVVDLYLASTPTLLQTMREAESGGDAEKLKAAAHSFKSSSANLGALKLAGVCRELEALGRKGSTEGALPLLMQVEEEYRMVRDALQGGTLC